MVDRKIDIARKATPWVMLLICMAIILWLAGLLNGCASIPVHTGIQYTIIRTELRKKIKSELPWDAKRFVQITVPNKTYYIPTRKELKRFLRANNVNALRYKRNKFNCLDFALILHADLSEYRYKFAGIRAYPWTVGQASYKGHMTNIALFREGRHLFGMPEGTLVWSFIEPQNDYFVDIRKPLRFFRM